MELNTVGRCKFGYVQQKVNIKSESENDTSNAQMMSWCKFVSSFSMQACLVSEKYS